MEIIWGLISILFQWTIYLFLCQDHNVLIMVALYLVLKSGNLVLPFQVCSSFLRLLWWIPHEFNGERTIFFHQWYCLVEKIVLWFCENWILICKWIKLDLYIILYVKINSNGSNLIFTSKCKRLNSKTLGRQTRKLEDTIKNVKHIIQSLRKYLQIIYLIS